MTWQIRHDLDDGSRYRVRFAKDQNEESCPFCADGTCVQEVRRYDGAERDLIIHGRAKDQN